MATYAIGDLQGCYIELLELLDLINFDKENDSLWFTGDLVNRGPQSLECLRFVKDNNFITVLGNHDLHLLAVGVKQAKLRHKDTLDEILRAADRDELLDWLLHRPLSHQDFKLGYTMVHAGLSPQWDIEQAVSCAGEVEALLRGAGHEEFFSHMYGDLPDSWSDNLQGWDRWRFITNCLTRIRYCGPDGRLTLMEKGPPGTQTSPFIPWFTVAQRKTRGNKIIFGHWATIRLGNKQDFTAANVYPLDGGCVWGGKLMALRLEDAAYFQVPSRQRRD
jgi:bis(5'-nucleosyl)-tetraphosphatase (symmetrical)